MVEIPARPADGVTTEKDEPFQWVSLVAVGLTFLNVEVGKDLVISGRRNASFTIPAQITCDHGRNMSAITPEREQNQNRLAGHCISITVEHFSLQCYDSIIQCTWPFVNMHLGFFRDALTIFSLAI